MWARSCRDIAISLFDPDGRRSILGEWKPPELRRKLLVVFIVAIVVGAALMATGIGHFIASTLQWLELQAEVNESIGPRLVRPLCGDDSLSRAREKVFLFTQVLSPAVVFAKCH
jgi:hypothetical protein